MLTIFTEVIGYGENPLHSGHLFKVMFSHFLGQVTLGNYFAFLSLCSSIYDMEKLEY